MNEITQQNNMPTNPGFGTAGIVMCPLMRCPCMKSGCEWWIELNYGNQKVARCAVSWGPVVTVELRQEIERLRNDLSKITEVKDVSAPA